MLQSIAKMLQSFLQSILQKIAKYVTSIAIHLSSVTVFDRFHVEGKKKDTNLYFRSKYIAKKLFYVCNLQSFLHLIVCKQLFVKCVSAYIQEMSASSKSASPAVSEKEKGSILGETISQKDIVCALAPLLRTEKKKVGGVSKEFCIRQCPNRAAKCKNKNGEIIHANKTGYKNPHSHLATCLFKVSSLSIEFCSYKCNF